MRPLAAWWGFASETDRQRVKAVLRRSVRSGLYQSQQTANDKLFKLVLQSGDRYVLHELLTDRVDISYNLRSRSHDKSSSREEGTLNRQELSH